MASEKPFNVEFWLFWLFPRFWDDLGDDGTGHYRGGFALGTYWALYLSLHVIASHTDIGAC